MAAAECGQQADTMAREKKSAAASKGPPKRFAAPRVAFSQKPELLAVIKAWVGGVLKDIG
jgi:hypothetical protein